MSLQFLFSAVPVSHINARMKMKSIFTGALLFIALFGVSAAYPQCGSCIDNFFSIYDEFKGSKAVFTGKVLEIKKIVASKNTDPSTTTDYYEFRIRFRVATAWKSDLPESLIVTNIGSKSSDFKIGERYLVYAYGRHYDPEKLRAHIGCCSRTKLFSNANEDLEVLKDEGERPASIIKQPSKGTVVNQVVSPRIN